jgi:hypothetical protein
MHQQQVDILDIPNEEGFMAGWHHVAGFLVAAISDLIKHIHQLPTVLNPRTQ